MLQPEILFVSHKYPPAIGGMEKQSYELINGAALYAKVHTLIYNRKESILLFFWHLEKRIKTIIHKNPNINVIHFNDGLLAAIASYHNGYSHIKKIATLHGLDVVFPLPLFQRKILPRFNTYDMLIAVSRATAEAAKARGIDAAKLTIINNGVDHGLTNNHEANFSDLLVRYPQLSKTKKYLLTLGRPVERKGFSWLLENVIPHLKGDIQLIMIGPFDQNPTRKEKLIKLLPQKIQRYLTLLLGFPTDQSTIRTLLQKKPKNVAHLGKVPYTDLQIILKNATAFLMPNIPVTGDMEGFGLVCLEASIAGTLVIASRLEGITDAITHQQNGILLKAMDTQGWTSKLQHVIDNPTYFQKKATAFRLDSINRFSWDKMSRNYIQLMFDLDHSVQNENTINELQIIHQDELQNK